VFSCADRMLLVRLVEAPAVDGSLLVYGVFDSERLQSSAKDERRIRSSIAVEQGRSSSFRFHLEQYGSVAPKIAVPVSSRWFAAPLFFN
jgi:hypothetical protein